MKYQNKVNLNRSQQQIALKSNTDIHSDLQRVSDSIQTVFRALRGGVAAPPMEGDASNLEL